MMNLFAYIERNPIIETVKTAGEPDHLEVIWANESENPEELCYMTVKVVDKDGNLCPKANNLISYEGEGFVAAANGDAACLDSFVEPKMHAFAGQLTAIVQSSEQAGSITLQATAKGLKPGSITLQTK